MYKCKFCSFYVYGVCSLWSVDKEPDQGCNDGNEKGGGHGY